MHNYSDCFEESGKIPGSFSISWEQRKLGELALFNPKDELPQTFEYVDLESVVGTEMLSHRTEVKSFAPSRAQRLAHTGDLFYQTVRPYQKNNYLFEKPDNNYVFSTGYAQMRPYVDGYFLLSLVQSERFVKVVLDNCTGTSYPAINANDLAEIEVAAPSDESEVQKIGTIFRSIDNLTTLHQRKQCILYIMKKLLCGKSKQLEKSIFWEQRKLGDNIVEYTEKTTENNQYPVLTSSRKGIFFQTDYYDGNQIASADNTGYNIVPYGYFTYRHMSDDEIFHFNINDIAENGIVSTLYPVFTTDENLDSRYLQYQLNYGREFARYAILQKQGGSRTYMYLNKLRNLYLTVPTAIEEQKKISEYFTNLDHLITLHQRKP